VIDEFCGCGTLVEEGYVVVHNVPPTVEAGQDQAVNEGDKVTFIGTFTDPGVLDTHTIAWDFGDGAAADGTLNPAHAYADDGVHEVTLTVEDDDGGVGSDTLVVTVDNVPPEVEAGPNRVVNEGDDVAFVGAFTDPGVQDTHMIEWDFGDGTTTSGTLNSMHVYADDGNAAGSGAYTVTLTVEDDDGGVGSDTLLVTVNNVPPEVDAGLNQAANEGDPVHFAGSFVDPGTLDTQTIEWNFGDGTTVGGTLNPTHFYADDGAYTVTLTVEDDDGGMGSDTLLVTVGNVPPEVDAGSDQAADEGSTVQFDGTFSDPGVLDPHTIEWDFGDGTVASGALNPTHTYADDGMYIVTLVVTDDDDVSSDTLVVTVNNVPPEVDAGPDQATNEGDAVHFTGTFSDPGVLDPHTIEWDFGDGTVASGALNPTHTYADDGMYAVTLVVTDDDDVSSDTLVVTVNNVPPEVDAGPDQAVDEGDAVHFAGTFSDPGMLDPHTIEWDFGDGTTVSGVLNTPHTYADDGVYTVTLTVTDDDDVSNDTLMVTVSNVPPDVDAGPDQDADEGDEVSFSGIFADPGILDMHTVEWDFGDGTIVGGTLEPVHTYADDGVYIVTLTAEDDDGGVGSDTLLVTVDNVAPWVGPITASPEPHQINTMITASALFTDSGLLDTHTAVWDWGDGTTSSGTIEETGGFGTATATHEYAVPGVYAIKLTVVDDDGGEGESIFRYVVIYDSGGGFVTGGGRIVSPEGAYTSDPSLTGKTNFGFNCKYKKNSSIPTGQTEFQFKGTDFNFHSDSYEWLVMSSVRAWYKGTGTLNGESGYKFLVTVVDADNNSDDNIEVDRFRIKIWYEDENGTEYVVYDSGLGVEDYPSDPTTGTIEIDGGSIVIHEK
jgi:PKD repeat protein